ncbi:FeoA family protein [Rhodovulum euryhalinum]|uniref:Ferrous iron transport protein A n=1 Tax=Rhodovulum euryhalinum TaxID=35805 RepID=A0A4R2KGV1_9RHOB|nr:FeoA family protein [Rhodovulum euryhalinum]TCO71642.1 ferrous iron transport protein A [Rhodovulum euryhalinum]
MECGNGGRKGWGGGWGWGRGRRRAGQAGCATPEGHGPAACAACPVSGSLDALAPGTTCRIRRLMGCGPIRQRLLDLGIRPCREVTVIRSAPLLDPIELKVGDSYIVLRRQEAAQVEVEDV